ASTAPEITFEQHPIQGQEYYFIRWDKDFTFVETDLTVNLVYGSRLQRFIVTIINGDETTEEVVEWGKDVILPTPFKSPNAQITYEFVGWSHNGKQIKQDTTIIATFNEVYKYYEVRFFDGDGKLLKLEYITPGQDANPPQD